MPCAGGHGGRVLMRRGDVVCGGLVLTCHGGGGQTANK